MNIGINETKFAGFHVIYSNVQFSQFLSLPSNNFQFVIKPHILIIEFLIDVLSLKFLMQSKMDVESIRIVAFDLETSGTMIHKDCILQIG